MSAPASAMSVANWFLERAWRDTGMPPIDQMKLYKLVFYAHAWHLGNGMGELYPESVEAWPHGPVVVGLYGEFKSFGREPISRFGRRLEPDGEGGFHFTTPKHDGERNALLELVWQSYKGFTGIQLSNMTHSPGEPWTVVAERYGYDLSTKPAISSEIIREIYARKVADGQKQAAH